MLDKQQILQLRDHLDRTNRLMRYHNPNKTSMEMLVEVYSANIFTERRLLFVEKLFNSGIIMESLDDSIIDKLSDYGYKVVDRFDTGEYTMLLLKANDDFYEISLTSKGQDFTTYSSQIKKSPDSNSGVREREKLLMKVRDWLNIQSPIMVGTFNNQRAHTYNRILKRAGFNVGEVSNNTGTAYFKLSK
jgi:hypothetical protein